MKKRAGAGGKGVGGSKVTTTGGGLAAVEKGTPTKEEDIDAVEGSKQEVNDIDTTSKKHGGDVADPPDVTHGHSAHGSTPPPAADGSPPDTKTAENETAQPTPNVSDPETALR